MLSTVPIFTLRRQGVHGGVSVLHEGRSKADAVAAFDRAMAKLITGTLVLERSEKGQSQIVKRGAAVPLERRKPRRRKRRMLPPEVAHDSSKPWPPEPDDE